MRSIHLSSNAGEPDVMVYDTSGPYTDQKATVDIRKGIEKLRNDWIEARGDVERYDGRQIKPEDNGLKSYEKSDIEEFQYPNMKPLRAKPGANVSQMHYAKKA